MNQDQRDCINTIVLNGRNYGDTQVSVESSYKHRKMKYDINSNFHK